MKNMFYQFLKKYSTTALHWYFSEWEVKGTEHIPDGPIVFAPNHQNAFLDAVLVACSSIRNPFFLARADVFKSPRAAKWLQRMQLLPVFRFRDGFATLKNNDATFKACHKLFDHGEAVLIFPEGNHGRPYQLRPLQKGLARMILSYKHPEKVAVVPVGIHYESHDGFRSRVLIQIGKPVYVSPDTTLELQQQLNLFTEKIAAAMKPLLLHIPDDRYEDLVPLIQKSRNIKIPVSQQLAIEQKAASGEISIDLMTPTIPGIFSRINRLWVRSQIFPASKLLHTLILQKLRDPQFIPSIKFGAGMVLLPLFLLIQALLIGYISGMWFIAPLYLVLVLGGMRMLKN